jgi:hypothetical protein
VNRDCSWEGKSPLGGPRHQGAGPCALLLVPRPEWGAYGGAELPNGVLTDALLGEMRPATRCHCPLGGYKSGISILRSEVAFNFFRSNCRNIELNLPC